MSDEKKQITELPFSKHPATQTQLYYYTREQRGQEQRDVRDKEEKEKIFDDEKNGWQEKRTEASSGGIHSLD